MDLLLWIIVALGVVMILTLVGQSIWSPIKWIGYGLFKIAMGGIILFVFNSIGGYYDFTIPINPVTAAMSGLLGIPGLVSLVIMKTFIVV